MKVYDELPLETPRSTKAKAQPSSTLLGTIHMSLWSAVGMIVVLAFGVGIAFKLFRPRAAHCAPGITRIYYKTTESFAGAGSRTRVPVLICVHGKAAQP